MRRMLLFLVALVAVLLVATTSATADSSYTDPAGDGKGGPDVTAVAVTNDAQGVITMRITTTSVAGTALMVIFDTDMNALVSDPTGRAILLATPIPGVVIPMAYARDAAGALVATSVPSMRATATATEITLSFAKAELGIDKGFGFWVAGMPPGDTNDLGEEAPDTGLWTYIVTTPPPPPPPVVVKPVIGKAVATAAIAGQKMAVSFTVTRSDTGGPLTAGTMTCDPSVSGRALAHRESFSAGKAKLNFVVPKAAKGKLLKVKLTISSDGSAATRVATFKVR